VNDGHGATGAAGSELLAKCSDLTQRDRSVIQPTGVNRNRVPTMNRVERIFRGEGGARGLDTVEARPKKSLKLVALVLLLKHKQSAKRIAEDNFIFAAD